MAAVLVVAVMLTHGARADMFGSVAPAQPTRAPSSTVAALPSCNTINIGLVYLVTDALIPVARAIVAGGGAIVIPVVCSGASWLVIG
jgi:hypothetical protein